MSTLTEASRDVLAERQRQVETEGWTPEHDDEHVLSELATAAALYALPRDDLQFVEVWQGRARFIDLWPWWNGGAYRSTGERAWDKRAKHNRRRRLVVAGALILAEIERLDRIRALKEQP